MFYKIQKKIQRVKLMLKEQSPATLSLAIPVILSQLGQMIMGVVDTLMVGPLGPEYIGGIGVGAAIFSALSVFGLGLTLGLDFLVSQAYGRKQMDECNYWLIQSVYLTAVVSVPLMIVGVFAAYHLDQLGINPVVARHGQEFLKLFIWSLPTSLFYFCFRTYLQSMNRVKFVTFLMVFGNLVNAFLDWLFIYGHFGIKPLFAAGPGIATCITRALILAAIVGYTFILSQKENWGLWEKSWKFHSSGFKKLFKVGLPAGLQFFFEVTVFALSTLLAGRLSPASLASHSIVLNIASLTFMVPLGLGSATSVRVGQYLGQGLHDKAKEAGWTSLIIGAVFMTTSGLSFYFLNRPILKLFTQDSQVLEIGRNLMLIAALFQIADGLQTVGTGALRGLGNTRAALDANIIGHWFFGLPIGTFLCFYAGYNISGLWIGLTVGLCSVAFIVVRSWHLKIGLVKPGLSIPHRRR